MFHTDICCNDFAKCNDTWIWFIRYITRSRQKIYIADIAFLPKHVMNIIHITYFYENAQQHDQKSEFRCEIWRSHSAVSDNWGRLREPCQVTGLIRRLHLPKSHNLRKQLFFLDCLFQNEGTTIFRNVGNHKPSYTASHFRRPQSLKSFQDVQEFEQVWTC